MKILFFADTVFSFGGVQRVLAETAKALAARHEVVVLTTECGEDLSMYGYGGSAVRFRHIAFPAERGLRRLWHKAVSAAYKFALPHCAATARLYAYSFFPPAHKRRLVEEINSGGYDAVVGVHVWLSMRLAAVRPELAAPVVVGWMHNSYQALTDPHGHYLPRIAGFFGHICRRLDRIVVLSEADRKLFAERLRLDADTIYNPLTVVPQGVGALEYRRFVAIGRFDPLHKGFDILIEAFARARTGWTLEIVGGGPEEARYRQMIARYGLEGQVVISPFTLDVQAKYRSASVYVLSSRWEGFGLVLVEAMAHGLPIVATRLPVTGELLAGRGVATLCRAGDADALAEALAKAAAMKPSDWQAASGKAIAYAKTFDIGATAKRWERELQRRPL